MPSPVDQIFDKKLLKKKHLPGGVFQTPSTAGKRKKSSGRIEFFFHQSPGTFQISKKHMSTDDNNCTYEKKSYFKHMFQNSIPVFGICKKCVHVHLVHLGCSSTQSFFDCATILLFPIVPQHGKRRHDDVIALRRMLFHPSIQFKR